MRLEGQLLEPVVRIVQSRVPVTITAVSGAPLAGEIVFPGAIVIAGIMMIRVHGEERGLALIRGIQKAQATFPISGTA